MAERTLILHWNEISIPANAACDDLKRNVAWVNLAQSAFDSFLCAQRARPDIRISFSRGVLRGEVAGRPFQSWMEHWLGKDRMRKLKARAVHPLRPPQVPIEHLDYELSVAGRCGEGITRAHLAESWAWSLGVRATGAGGEEIQADKTTMDTDGAVQVGVRNLACIEHGEHWASDLAEWGMRPSENHVIAEADGLLFIMYPLDHGYAHVHVHARDNPGLNAKYRVDKFEPLTNTNPPGLDGLMERWIAENRDLLLQSWSRCQAGKFPLKLEGGAP